MFEPFLIYLALINVVTFLVWGWDKRAAKQDKRRVPEKRLLWMVMLLGTVGAWLGVRYFRHKTVKASFRWKLIAITLLQLVFLGYSIYWKWTGKD